MKALAAQDDSFDVQNIMICDGYVSGNYMRKISPSHFSENDEISVSFVGLAAYASTMLIFALRRKSLASLIPYDSAYFSSRPMK